MKATVFIFSSAFMTMLVVAIISTITMKSSYAELIRQSLDDSVEFSVYLLQNGVRDAEGNSLVGESGNVVVDNISRVVVWDNWNSTSIDDESKFDERNTAFKQDFCSYLVSNIDTRVRSLDVNIYGADFSKGLLSVEIVARFQYPSGSWDSVTTYKTIILDKTLRQQY